MSFASSSNPKAPHQKTISPKNHDFVLVQRAVEAERCCALPVLSTCCAFLLTLTPCPQHWLQQSRYRNHTRMTPWEIGQIFVRRTFMSEPATFSLANIQVAPFSLALSFVVPLFSAHSAMAPGPQVRFGAGSKGIFPPSASFPSSLFQGSAQGQLNSLAPHIRYTNYRVTPFAGIRSSTTQTHYFYPSSISIISRPSS